MLNPVVAISLFLGQTFGAAVVNRAPAVKLPCLGPAGFDPLVYGQHLACALRLPPRLGAARSPAGDLAPSAVLLEQGGIVGRVLPCSFIRADEYV